MTDTKTPGQIAHEAYMAALPIPPRQKTPWHWMALEQQAAWEAAAQAVGEQAITDLLLVQRLAQGEDEDDAHADA